MVKTVLPKWIKGDDGGDRRGGSCGGETILLNIFLHQAPEPRGHRPGLQAEVPRQVRQGGEQQEVHPVHEGGGGGLGQDQPEDLGGIQARERAENFANKSKETSKTLKIEEKTVMIMMHKQFRI